jgi:outer membrane protein assembly factor BamE
MQQKMIKNFRLPIAMTLAILVLSACGLIYKQNIQQGNALEQEDLDELYIGMNKRQVSFVLGSPSIHDPFQQQRWDYVQTFSRRGGELIQRTVTLRFDDDLLAEIIGVDKGINESLSAVDDPATSSDDEASAIETDPNASAIAAAEDEVLEPETQGLGERSAEERKMEEDMDVLNQRSPGDISSPDIDG